VSNINVAVVGSPGFSRELGKRGTESDVTFYNMKKGEDTVTLLEPTRYPEKMASLFYASSFADIAVLVVERIDAAFGESVLMLDSVGVDRGVIVLRNYISEEKVGRFLKGIRLQGYEVIADEPAQLREWLMAEAHSNGSGSTGAGVGTVVVDHSYNVRGIGAVALGVVRGGTVSVHDHLNVLPGGKVAQVRSIQKHDDNFDSAGVGDRVGLALKGVDVKDIARGSVLSGRENLVVTSAFSSKVRLVPYWLNPLREGMVLHLGHWMQFNAARVESIEDNGDGNPVAAIRLERPLVHPSGSRAVVTYLDGGNLRIVGSADLP